MDPSKINSRHITIQGKTTTMSNSDSSISNFGPASREAYRVRRRGIGSPGTRRRFPGGVRPVSGIGRLPLGGKGDHRAAVPFQEHERHGVSHLPHPQHVLTFPLHPLHFSPPRIDSQWHVHTFPLH